MVGEGLGRASEMINDGADLGLLLRCERSQAAQPLTEALLDKSSNGDGRDIQSAARRLLRRHAPYALDLAAPAAALIRKAGDERSRRLFVGWCLRPDGRSQAQLGCEEGVSASRVGQIVQSAERQVRAALIESPAPLPWAVRSFRRQLGAVTTGEQLSRALAGLGARKSPAAELLPWLAGPYCAVPRHAGWLAVEPRRLITSTRDCLAADGGVRRLVDVQAELADLEIEARQLVCWLQANGVTVIHELAVFVGGPLPDAIERVLDAHGASRTPEQIAAELAAGGRTIQPGALAAALRQRRFARAGNRGIALAAWPREPRSATRPLRRARRSGKPRPQTNRERPARMVGVREPPPEASVSPARFWLWVRVDADVLRGAEAAVPVALVEGLGLSPLSRRTFRSRWGPVTLAYDGLQPTRGSVRAIALAAGARPDDTLLLGFSPSHQDVTVEVRRGSVLTTDAGTTNPGVNFFPELASGGTP